VNLPATGQGGYDPATVAISLFNNGATRYLNLELSALEADGKGKIVSSPRIITADQIKASISQGTKVPFQRSTSSGATSVEFIEATLKLEVTPQITPEGNVILDVKVNKDSLGTLTALGREINVKEVKTNVLVENGGTVVIGGIFEQNDSVTQTKVPLLGDVPVLGNLFKTTTKDSSRTELLVFLTPRIVTEKAAVR
jgi:type IV pilus assembly protein PilQ